MDQVSVIERCLLKSNHQCITYLITLKINKKERSLPHFLPPSLFLLIDY